jgi:GNAT superfamily N-acetyltransferase
MDHQDVVRIEWYDGSRVSLRALFEEAEDSAAQLASYLDQGRVLVAIADEMIIGHLQLVATDVEAEIELKSMAVTEDRRGTGIGTRLVEEALAEAGRDRPVDDDPEEPAPQRRTALERVDAAQEPHPGVLDHLLGHGPRSYPGEREPHHRLVVPLDQLGERGLVPCPEALHQPALVVVRAVRRTPGRNAVPRGLLGSLVVPHTWLVPRASGT